MQQPVTRRDVYVPGVSAVVAGRSLEVSQVNVDRSLPDPYAGDRLTAASASITAVEGEDVTQTVATPWDPSTSWPPAPESSASVSMDTGAGMVSLLADGRVVSASGGTSGREVSVEVSDRYSSLDKTISWDNLADAMPLVAEAEGDRYVGLQSVAVTDRILRHCGWYATPPPLSYTILSVPAMGTMWPESGRVDTSGRISTSGGYPYWDATSWGVGVHDVLAQYTLAGAAYTLKERNNIELVAMTTATAGSDRLDVTTLSGAGLFRLSWTQSTGYVAVRNAAGSFQNVASVPRSEGMLYATVSYVSDSSISATIRSGTASSSGTLTVPSIVTNESPRRATINIPTDSHASGFMVAMPAAAGGLVGWKPSVNMRMRQFNRNYLRVLRAVESENCADLLAQQCEAEAATYWIDELGVLQWWDLGRLETQSNVATLTSDDDIAEGGFSWSHDHSQVKSRVLVKWQEPLAERKWRTAVDLWTGSGKSVAQGDATVSQPLEEWINVPDNEVWIAPDLSMLRVGDAGSIDEFNGGVGSFYGAIYSPDSSSSEQWAQIRPGSFLVSAERVTDSSFKVSTVWTGTDTVVQRTAGTEAGSSLWSTRRNLDLPIIRGRAKYKFLERDTYSSQSGPSSAPEHAIDAGFWIQVPEQATYTANYAGARLTAPQPVLSSVDLIPFPGLQLGDVVTVTDTSVSRLTVRGVVIEDSRDIDADMSMSHAVTVRPTSVTRNGVTWREWSQFTNKTWSQWQSSEGGTWAAWGANPLNT